MPRDPAAEMAAECGKLWRYMVWLERIVAEPVAVAGGAAPGLHGRQASPPVPGHAQALFALMSAHERLRRVETDLQAAQHLPARRRGGSDDATARLIEQLPKLAVAVQLDDVDRALYWLAKCIGEAKAVHGIDEARAWRPLPRPRPGEERPPRCPRCKTYNLRADVEARVVVCTRPGCEDRNGLPPVAQMGTGPDGRGRLYWADGTEEDGVELCTSGGG